MTQHPAVWRITPVAHPQDGAWQGRSIWKELQIVASTAGEALLEADRHYEAAHGIRDALSLDRQQVRSGFSDTKLYRVDRTGTPASAPSGTVVFEELL